MSDQERGSSPDWGGDEDLQPPRRAIPLGPSPLAADEPGTAQAGAAIPDPVRSRDEEAHEPGDQAPGPSAPEPPRPPRTTSTQSVARPSTSDEPEDDGEPFNLAGTEKLGIIGGKGVGKSFLFQAMVYRTYAKTKAGVMNQFLDKTHLFEALQRSQKARPLVLGDFGNNYMSWGRLPQTLLTNQRWYRLRLHYRTGILRTKRSAMDVEFFDGSGEGFFEAARTRGISEIWRDGYLDARVMVFCLPLWAAFPGSSMTSEDRKKRKEILLGFEKVVQNYEELRRAGQRTQQPVKSILALTMADDSRGALSTLYEKWIAPYMESPQLYLPKLARESGVARYLANARRVSEALHLELAASRDPRVSAIPQMLDFGSRPWLIPLSAIEGRLLDRIERQNLQADDERPPAPVPVHVELPLLVALCERHNALM